MIINGIELKHGMKVEIGKYNDIIIDDKRGNRIYHVDSDGHWYKREYDENSNLIYHKESDGYWEKREYDKQGNKIYQEDSHGLVIDKRPKTITIDGKEIELSKESYENLKKHFKADK